MTQLRVGPDVKFGVPAAHSSVSLAWQATMNSLFRRILRGALGEQFLLLKKQDLLLFAPLGSDDGRSGCHRAADAN